jgi:hypothetical protein
MDNSHPTLGRKVQKKVSKLCFFWALFFVEPSIFIYFSNAQGLRSQFILAPEVKVTWTLWSWQSVSWSLATFRQVTGGLSGSSLHV